MGANLRQVLVAVLAAIGLLSACTGHAAKHDRLSHAPSASSGQTPVTRRDIGLAKTAAEHEIAAQAHFTRSVSIATVAYAQNPFTGSNTGHVCPQGRILEVRIYGEFNIVHGGLAQPPSSSTSKPGYEAILAWTDPASGTICNIGFNPGPTMPTPQEVVLLTR